MIYQLREAHKESLRADQHARWENRVMAEKRQTAWLSWLRQNTPTLEVQGE